MEEKIDGTPTSEIEIEDTNSTEEIKETTQDVVVPRKIKVKYLQEDKEVTEDEAIPYIQKGMNYDHIKEKADKAEAELSELRAKLAERELETGRDKLEKQLLQDGYDTDTVTKISETAFKQAKENLDKTKAETEKLLMMSKRASEKETLSKKPFYKEIEKDLDVFMADPNNSRIPAEVAYKLMLGDFASSDRYQEMIKNTKQSAIADYQDSTKRTGQIKSDATPSNDVDVNSILDEKSIEMTRAFGLDPKKIAKYVADTLKKKG